MGEGRQQEERPPIVAAGQVVDGTDRSEGHLLVEVHLERCLADAGLEHAAHVVVPEEPVRGWPIPVRCPVQTSGIEISGDALLEPVELIRADEVHLAGQAGPIATPPQVVGQRGHGGRQFGRVVVDADL